MIDFYLCWVDDDDVFIGFVVIRFINNSANAFDHGGKLK